ncbi:hypothetical protein F2Q69_00062164 [Brassica cretica]|uniref:Uncharacterized protein n=1 Tax=Brassica cretica TaxID=69181 RepID=A0A8S9RQU9_BRACR|nr:hypothetical protein F2Q69_00062164 [Brassica cretica]
MMVPQWINYLVYKKKKKKKTDQETPNCPGSIFEASLSSPITSQSLTKHEVPLSLRSDPYSLSQISDMSSVEAYSPLPIAVLLVPNAGLIRVE